MKTFILFSCLLYSICLGAEKIDVIHLENGDIIKGQITENVINEYIKIELQGGSLLTYRYSAIEKITKESVQNWKNKQSNTQTFSTNNTQQIMMYQSQKKSEGTAMIFTFLLPTAGHAYAGNWGKGVGLFAAEIGLMIMASTIGISESCDSYDYGYYYSYCDYEPNGLFYVGFFGAIATRLYEIFDAGKEVRKYNQRLMMRYGINPGFSMNIIPKTQGAELKLAYNFR